MDNMKKVYQNIVGGDNGDCARAVMASLFDLDLDQVPPLYPNETQGREKAKFLESKGYVGWRCFYKEDWNEKPTIKEVAKVDGGINGYFYASVPSQTFEGVSHAVVVDKELNIIHDPNPNQLALKLTPEDIIYIVTVDDWFIDKGEVKLN